MGEVWLATHNTLGGEFAIKLVETTDDIEAETAAGRFQLEAQIAAKLSRRTRHIVSVSDHGEEGGLAYLVMELLEGESLEARVKRVGCLDLPEVAAILMQVSRALSLAHEEGIFHRDLKPANVFLTKDEDGKLLVKLLDFGIARTKKPFRTRSPFATSKDMVLGTPSYMSPEQARGLDTLDYRCDLWALAVVAYEALTKRIPFEGDTVEDIFLSICTFRVVPALARRSDLPPAVEEFFKKAFAPKLEDRFASALELTAAFEQLVSPEALEAAIGGPPARISERNLPRAVTPSQPQIVVPTPNDQVMPKMPESNPHLSADPIPVWGDAGSNGNKRRGGGVIIAVAGIAGAVAIIVFLLVAFRGSASTKTTSTNPPAPDTAATNTATANTVPPPPTVVEPAPTIADVAPTNDVPVSPVSAKPKAVPKTGPRPTTAANAKTPPVTTAGTVAPTPPPVPTPKDKSGVF